MFNTFQSQRKCFYAAYADRRKYRQTSYFVIVAKLSQKRITLVCRFFTERISWYLQKRGTALNFKLHIPYVIILWGNLYCRNNYNDNRLSVGFIPDYYKIHNLIGCQS